VETDRILPAKKRKKERIRGREDGEGEEARGKRGALLLSLSCSLSLSADEHRQTNKVCERVISLRSVLKLVYRHRRWKTDQSVMRRGEEEGGVRRRGRRYPLSCG